FQESNQVVLHIPDGTGRNVHGVHRDCSDQRWSGYGMVDGRMNQSLRNTCVSCGGNRRFPGQFRSYVYPAPGAPVAQPAPVPGLTSAERLRRGQEAMARMRATQLAALGGAGEPVGPPATAGAGAGAAAGVVGGGAGVVLGFASEVIVRERVPNIEACSIVKHLGQCYFVGMVKPCSDHPASYYEYHLSLITNRSVSERFRDIADWTPIPDYKILYDHAFSHVVGAVFRNPDGNWQVIAILSDRVRFVQRVGEVTTAPVVSPARAGAGAGGGTVGSETGRHDEAYRSVSKSLRLWMGHPHLDVPAAAGATAGLVGGGTAGAGVPVGELRTSESRILSFDAAKNDLDVVSIGSRFYAVTGSRIPSVDRDVYQYFAWEITGIAFEGDVADYKVVRFYQDSEPPLAVDIPERGRCRRYARLNAPSILFQCCLYRRERVATAPVGPPARAIEAATGLSVELQAAVIAQITTPGEGYNECPVCMESLCGVGTIWVCNACEKAIGHLEGCLSVMPDLCPLCQAKGSLVKWTPPAGLAVRPAATTGGAPAGATAGVGSGPAGVVGGAGSDGVSAGAGAGPAVLAIVSGVKQLRVSPALPIVAAQRAGSLPAGFITANTLVRFGTTVAYILSEQQYQVLPPDVVVGALDEYKVSNSRVAAPRGYTKVASFAAANDDGMFIYHQNAPTS
ncbi:MAG: hypothetical protein WCJ17_00330, partial [bacterium]